MLARWAAYEKSGRRALRHLRCGNARRRRHVFAELKNIGKRAKESLSHLERIKTVPITIEEYPRHMKPSARIGR